MAFGFGPQQQMQQAQQGMRDMSASSRYASPTMGAFSGGTSNGRVGQQMGQQQQPMGQPQQPQSNSWAAPTNTGTAVSSAASGNAGQQPQYAGQGTLGQYMPQGYDPTKWANQGHNTPKYDIGRILSKYPPTPEGLQQAAAEVAASGHGTVTGKDKITLAQGNPEYGGHVIDVGQNFSGNADNKNWYWGDITANPSSPQMGAPSQGGQQELLSMIQQLMSSGQGGMMKPNMNTSLASSPYGPQGQSGPQGQGQMDISSFLGNGPNRAY